MLAGFLNPEREGFQSVGLAPGTREESQKHVLTAVATAAKLYIPRPHAL